MSDGLPQQAPETHPPKEPVRRAPVPNVIDDRWYVDDRTMMVLLNGLRRWQVMDR
ncbi:hypothetical protein [Krasilnikovia sp. MM14-A1259]|uniref:hypothetical protein n=1 Tax=Krasilnikovia sp. MM14-A1259 TaxID=3373539 RepID=UPI0037F28AE6